MLGGKPARSRSDGRRKTWAVGLALAGLLSTRCSALVDTDGLTGATSETTSTDGGASSEASFEAPADGGADTDARALPADAVVFPGNGHGYRVVVESDAVSWTVAKTRAEQAGGHLATIASADENLFVFQLANGTSGAFRTNGGPWLGGFQQSGAVEPAGGWTWVTNEPWGYQNWTAGEPTDTGGDEAYLELNPTPPSATWNDIDVTTDTRSYVIEFE